MEKMEIFEWGKSVKVSTRSSSGEGVGKKTIDVISNRIEKFRDVKRCRNSRQPVQDMKICSNSVSKHYIRGGWCVSL